MAVRAEFGQRSCFFVLFLFVLLVTMLALLLGVSSVLGVGGPLKNLERRYSRLFFALLLLGFLAQYVNDFFIAREAGNPCAFRGPLGCDVLTYHQLQDEAGVGVALIGLVLLLAYEFVPLAYRFVFRRALLSPGRAVEQNT